MELPGCFYIDVGYPLVGACADSESQGASEIPNRRCQRPTTPLTQNNAAPSKPTEILGQPNEVVAVSSISSNTSNTVSTAVCSRTLLRALACRRLRIDALPPEPSPSAFGVSRAAFFGSSSDETLGRGAYRRHAEHCEMPIDAS